MSSIYRTLTYVVCLSTGILWFPQPYSYLCNYLLFIQRYISTMNGICKEALSYICGFPMHFGSNWQKVIQFMMLGIMHTLCNFLFYLQLLQLEIMFPNFSCMFLNHNIFFQFEF